jgi:ABC-type transport system involved in cytochrome c biogenesis permease subunit
MSTTLLTVAGIAYLASFVGFALGQLAGKGRWETLSIWLTRAAWVAQAVAFGMRWTAGGGKSPPVISIYESLHFVSWSVIAAHLYYDLRHESRWAGAFSALTAFLLMGIAALYPDSAREYPLLTPALQSRWIYFHVLVACLAYGFLALGSFTAVFHLVREKVETDTLQMGVSLLSIGVLSSAAGKAFFQSGQFHFFKVIRDLDGGLIPVNFILPNGQAAAQFVAIPWAGLLVGIVLGLFVLHFVLGAFASSKVVHPLRWIFGGATLGLFALMVLLIVSNWSLAGFQIFSNPYRFAAVVGLSLLSAWFMGLLKWREVLEESLPEARTLDRWSFQALMAAFVFLTLTLISGSIWAHYAWGRYWGWDAKETWTLICWLVVCIYLHIRVMDNWEGKQAAWVAIACFFVAAFTFLGVNLLFPGLHSFMGAG